MKRVVASVLQEDIRDEVEQAIQECLEYPVSERVLNDMLAYESYKTVFLDGVIACGDALNRGDLDGIRQLRELMQRYGTLNVLSLVYSILGA